MRISEYDEVLIFEHVVKEEECIPFDFDPAEIGEWKKDDYVKIKIGVDAILNYKCPNPLWTTKREKN